MTKRKPKKIDIKKVNVKDRRNLLIRQLYGEDWSLADISDIFSHPVSRARVYQIIQEEK